MIEHPAPHKVIQFFWHGRNEGSKEVTIQFIRSKEEGIEWCIPHYLSIKTYK